MRRNKFLYALLCLLTGINLSAQEKKTVLTPEAVMELVRNNHPVAKQAALLVNRAAAELQSARGAFDPALEMEASRKPSTERITTIIPTPKFSYLPLPLLPCVQERKTMGAICWLTKQPVADPVTWVWNCRWEMVC